MRFAGLRLFGFLLGVTLLAWFIAHTDIGQLLGVFQRIGWAFLAIMAARGATIFSDCGAWRCLLPPEGRPSFWAMLPLRWIGEAINTTLPAAQIGGEVVRGRLLQQRVTAPARGAASVVVDFCLSLLAQMICTLSGFILLIRLSAATSWWPAALCALAVPAFAIFSWELLVRRRLLTAVERLAERLGQRRLPAMLRNLAGALGLLAIDRRALGLSLALHFLSWAGHIGELWLTLTLMGNPIGIAEAAMLESLSLGARSAAFLIPSGWGAQEAALMALAALTGVAPQTALALGLVKRAREFAIGLPGLLTWAMIEQRPVR